MLSLLLLMAALTQDVTVLPEPIEAIDCPGDYIWTDRDDWSFVPITEDELVQIKTGASSVELDLPELGVSGALLIRSDFIGDLEVDGVIMRELHIGLRLESDGAERAYRLVYEGSIPTHEETSLTRNKRPFKIEAANFGPDVPLVGIRYENYDMGANTLREERETLLFDLRLDPPRVVQTSCVTVIGGGACGAHNYHYSDKTSRHCEWNMSLDDFDCTEERLFNARWSVPESVWRYALISGESLPVEHFAHVVFSDLDTFAISLALEEEARFRRTVVQRIGTLTPIEARAMGEGVTRHLFGAPWSGHAFAPPLVVVDTADRKVLRAELIHTLQVPDEGTAIWRRDAKEERYPYRSGAEFTPIHSGVWQVGDRWTWGGIEVTELWVKSGDSTALLWLGVDAESGRIAALRIASDAAEYDGCYMFRYPASLTSIDLEASEEDAPIAGVASTIVDREGHWVSLGSEPDCDITGTLSWSPLRGFIVQTSSTPCGERSPRIISIGGRQLFPELP